MDAKAKLRVQLNGSDEIAWDGTQFTFVGCDRFVRAVRQWMQTLSGPDPKSWAVPANDSHHSGLLIREFVLRAQGKWEFPYKSDELCHCRHVAATTVDDAILFGALSVQEVALATGASTGCGTCLPLIDSILKYRTSG